MIVLKLDQKSRYSILVHPGDDVWALATPTLHPEHVALIAPIPTRATECLCRGAFRQGGAVSTFVHL